MPLISDLLQVGIQNNTAVLTFLGVVLGGAIAGVIGYVTENWRYRNERKSNHFERLKHDCLIPIRNDISNKLPLFKIQEGQNLFTHDKATLAKIPDLNKYYYAKNAITVMSYTNPTAAVKVNTVLLTDLFKNHYKKLEKDIEEANKAIRKHRHFAELIDRLTFELNTDSEYKLLFQACGDDAYKVYSYTETIIGIMLGGTEKNFPNWFKEFSTKPYDMLDAMKGIAKRNMKSDIAKEIIKEQDEILSSIKVCLNEIDEIIEQTKLQGNCKYTNV